MSSLVLVFNDRTPHLITDVNDYTWDFGRGLVVAVAKTHADGSIGSFQLNNIDLPGPTGNPQWPKVSWSGCTPSALYVNDGITAPKLYIASAQSVAQAGVFYTLDKGLKFESMELVTGMATSAPPQLSWWGMKANIAFRTNGSSIYSCVAQRNGANPQHPNWGNWEVLTVRPKNSQGQWLNTRSQPAVLDLADNVLCFRSSGDGGNATDGFDLRVSIISSEIYPKTQDDANIKWPDYRIDGVKLCFSPAPLYTNDGSNRVFVFIVGTDGYLWVVTFKVDDDGFPSELTDDKSTIRQQSWQVPGTQHRIASTPSPVIYNDRIYVFFRGPNVQLQYVFGDLNGLKWSVGSSTNVFLTIEESLQKGGSLFAAGGVSAVVVDDPFLQVTS